MIIKSLSFSRLKALAESPRALMRYLNRDTAPTAAMIQGDLVDVLLFTPEVVRERFLLLDKNVDKRTKEGKTEWESIKKEAGSRLIMELDEVQAAQRIADGVKSSATVMFNGLLNTDFYQFQHEIDFKYKGFQHRGRTDAQGKSPRTGRNVIWDLKVMSGKSGEREVRWEIKNNLLDLQAAIYAHPFDSVGEELDYYIISVNKDGDVTPFEISLQDRQRARFVWDRLIGHAHRLNMEDSLDFGPEWFTDGNGFFPL